MESKNVKVIDEHSIDRTANVICKFTTNNIDYVLYAIERDNDNDNLFVSKLVNNIDGTASMVNIEDSNEKSKINDLAKNLVMHAIKNENDVTSSVVELADGNEIKIDSVLFNKDQNINVAKTYITTVKKTATKVSENFYQSGSKKEPVVSEPVVEPVPEMPEVVAPVEDVTQEPEIEHEPTNEEIMNSFVETPAEEVKTEEPALPELKEEKEEEPVLEETPEPIKVEEPVVEPVLPVVEAPKVEEKVEPVAENVPEPVKAEELKTEPTSQPAEETKEEVKVDATPIIPTVSAIPVQSVEAPEVSAQPEPLLEETPELIFDASKETNLNIALGEVTSETSVKVDDAAAFREFGQDSPAKEAPVQESQPVTVLEKPASVKTLTRSKGFANSKFVTVIAILFFVAACVFLGYEIFNYFQLTK